MQEIFRNVPQRFASRLSPPLQSLPERLISIKQINESLHSFLPHRQLNIFSIPTHPRADLLLVAILNLSVSMFIYLYTSRLWLTVKTVTTFFPSS
jgi:hypothetical protein